MKRILLSVLALTAMVAVGGCEKTIQEADAAPAPHVAPAHTSGNNLSTTA